MAGTFRIAVLGIGGVGGFIGGKLAAQFAASTDIEIIFLARGAHETAIRENGLQLHTSEGDIIAHPNLITSDSGSIGPIDLLICCTKTYNLVESLGQLANSIHPDTIILPLLNGVDNAPRVRDIFPHAKVLEGCIYIAARRLGPGEVQQSGSFYAVYYGTNGLSADQSTLLESIFKDAGINAFSEEDIITRLWTKFAFVSPIATYTSAYDVNIGTIRENQAHKDSLAALMQEVILLAKIKGIVLPEDSVAANFAIMEKLKYETTSSMQLDFSNGNLTELETLTGYVVKEAEQRQLLLPNYEILYRQLAGL